MISMHKQWFNLQTPALVCVYGYAISCIMRQEKVFLFKNKTKKLLFCFTQVGLLIT